MLKSFKDLKVWQKSYDLCLKAYRMTTTFPKNKNTWTLESSNPWTLVFSNSFGEEP
ncbi:MAG: four helix bundle protein [Deltaproteobacteria bacterium]|nr:four helix bundle protein [Deltaproteobacteria bacterium]